MNDIDFFYKMASLQKIELPDGNLSLIADPTTKKIIKYRLKSLLKIADKKNIEKGTEKSTVWLKCGLTEITVDHYSNMSVIGIKNIWHEYFSIDIKAQDKVSVFQKAFDNDTETLVYNISGQNYEIKYPTGDDRMEKVYLKTIDVISSEPVSVDFELREIELIKEISTKQE